MHEVGLLSAAIEDAVTTARRSGAVQITRLTFAIPSGGHVTPEAVATLVPALSAGTIAEGAEIAVENIAIRYLCLGCGAVYESDAHDPPCPVCGHHGLADEEAPEVTLVAFDVAE